MRWLQNSSALHRRRACSPGKPVNANGDAQKGQNRDGLEVTNAGQRERADTTTIRIDAWINSRNANARSRLNHVANAQTKGETTTMK